jgi:hypothetical protein
MVRRGIDEPEDEQVDEEATDVSHSPTRIAAAALLGVTATATLVALPAPIDAATPKANTVYKAVFTDPVYEITASITIRIGNDKTRVKKVTAVLSCEAGTQAISAKNVKIDSEGFVKEKRGTHLDGSWLSKNKMLASAEGNPSEPCGGYYMQSVAKAK